MFDITEADSLLILVRREMHRCRRMMRGVSRHEWEVKYCHLAIIETKLEFIDALKVEKSVLQAGTIVPKTEKSALRRRKNPQS